MNLTQSIDIYCERLDSGFWAEPVNALTNIAFVAAAVWAWRLAARRGALDGGVWLLVLLAALVGVGSFLFHTFAQRWSGAADVGAILAFALAFLLMTVRRLYGASWLVSGAALLGGLGFIWGMRQAAVSLGMGQFALYAPIFIGLALLVGGLAVAGNRAWRLMGLAMATLCLSLFLRTIDGQVCGDFPLGTHFLWHLLNGGSFALLLSAIVLHSPPSERVRP